MVLVEQQYKDIRKKLDKMGYHQPCSVESMLLVGKLLNDLECTREKLLLSEDVADNVLKKYEEIERSIDTCGKENNRLFKENNKLHLDAIQNKEESERKIKELKGRICDLENMYSDLEFNYMELMTNMGASKQESLDKNTKLCEVGRLCAQDSYEKRRNSHHDELENYKQKHRQLLDEIVTLENQLQSRDKEIARLGYQLEEKNWTAGYGTKRCSCHLKNSCHTQNLTTAEMYEKLKTAQDKQHEAMQRAIVLADHIHDLEKEINEIKNKKEMNTKCSCETNITFLQNQYSETLNKIKEMEKRITKLQILINNLTKEKDEATDKIIKLEKEKSNLQEKLGNSNSIEKDLSREIDRLTQKNADLKNEIAHLVEKNSNLLTQIQQQPSKTTNENVCTKETENLKRSDNSTDSLCEKFKAERDYYCNELHRLQERVYSAERLHDLRCCSRSENVMEASLLKKIRSDLNFAREENKRLQEEVVQLKSQLKQMSHYRHDTTKLTESHIKKLEYDKEELLSSNNNLKSKLHTVEYESEHLSKKISQLTEQLENYKVKYNHLKKVNNQLEFSLKNSESTTRRTELELDQCVARLNDLEKQLKCLLDENIKIKKEKQEVRENLLRLDNEKDDLLLKLDEKTIYISQLDRDIHYKNNQIAQIESKNSELINQLQCVEKMLQVAEEKSRAHIHDGRKMEQDIIALQSCKEKLVLENQTLRRELEAVSQDIILTNEALEISRRESEKLKRELQTYVDEVRRVEKILLEKEQEREALLEQFNALSAEASHLECNQQSLECEANMSKDSLRDTQEKLYALQKDATAKESMMSHLEQQTQQLADQVIHLQAKLSEMSDRELILTTDLDAARNLCSTLEDQKQYYNKQLSQMVSSEKMLRNELQRLEYENETLHNRLSQEEENSYTMEKVLTSSRHDVMEKCLYNDDLTKEVNKMKETVVELEAKLNSVKSALSNCQSVCADYHAQNVQLKRQITNDQFEKAKDLDSNSTSL